MTQQSSRLRPRSGTTTTKTTVTVSKTLVEDMHAVNDADKEIAKLEAKVKKLQGERAAALGRVGQSLAAANISQYEKDGLIARYKVIKGRASSSYNMKELRRLIDDDDKFMQCVDVVASKAKAVIPSQTLDAVKTTIPAHDKEELVVEATA